MRITEREVRRALEGIALKPEQEALGWWGRGEMERVRESLGRYTYTLNFIPKLDGEVKVLDVGIGYGHLAILVKRLFGYQVVGVDKEVPPSLKGRFDEVGIEFKECDITRESIPYGDSSFDLVLFCDALHLLQTHPAKVFQEIHRVLREGGSLVLFTPNALNLITRLKVLAGRAGTDWKAEYPHFHHYTMKELEFLLGKGRFAIEEVEFCTFANPALERSVLKRTLFLLYFLVAKLRPPFRDGIMVRARKV